MVPEIIKSLDLAKLKFKFEKSLKQHFKFVNLSIEFLTNNPHDIVLRSFDIQSNLCKDIERYLKEQFNHDVKSLTIIN